MNFPEPVGSRDPMPEPPKHIMSEPEITRAEVSDDYSFVGDAVSTPVAPASEQVGGRVIALDTIRDAVVSHFEHDDLDVPAFLRKRNEVM